MPASRADRAMDALRTQNKDMRKFGEDREEDLPMLERRAARVKAKRMAKRGGGASAARGRVRRDRAFSQRHTLTFPPAMPPY